MGRIRRLGREGLARSGHARPRKCTARCLAGSLKCRACGSSRVWTLRCRRRANIDVELLLQSDLPIERLLETTGAVLTAGWQSGMFLYVDTDLKIDLPEARVVLDRERLADLGFDLAGVGRELGTMLGGAYVNRFNYFDRSYKVIPQLGDKDRSTVGPCSI